MVKLQGLKDIIFWEKDKDFFDKEATIKEYFAICPPEKRRHVDTYEELYLEALKFVEKQDFAENTQDQEDYFYEMDKTDGAVAVLIGVFAYMIATQVDKNGKKLEKKIDKLLPDDFDKNNPFDTKVGKGHRNFGHDLIFGLKRIPSDYPICVGKMGRGNRYKPIGDVVGKDGRITMLDLIWHYYGKGAKNPIAGIFNCAGHTIVHFAKDLLTSEGVPLPFTSLCNEYFNLADEEEMLGLGKAVAINQDDYELENKFNDWVNKVNGNLKASDFATLGFIEGMCKLYAHSKKLEDKKKEKSFSRDLKILSMGTCLMVQMSSLIIGKNKGKKGMIPGAKLNAIMAGVLMKNMTHEMAVVVKARHQVNVEYDRRLKAMKGDDKNGGREKAE